MAHVNVFVDNVLSQPNDPSRIRTFRTKLFSLNTTSFTTSFEYNLYALSIFIYSSNLL